MPATASRSIKFRSVTRNFLADMLSLHGLCDEAEALKYGKHVNPELLRGFVAAASFDSERPVWAEIKDALGL